METDGSAECRRMRPPGVRHCICGHTALSNQDATNGTCLRINTVQPCFQEPQIQSARARFLDQETASVN